MRLKRKPAKETASFLNFRKREVKQLPVVKRLKVIEKDTEVKAKGN